MINPYIYSGLPVVKQAMAKLGVHHSDPENIIESTCIALDIDPLMFLSKSRKRKFVQARQLAIYFILELNPRMALTEVGRKYLGGMDHSTVIYSRNLYSDLYGRDKEFTDKANAVKDRLML